MRSRVGLALFLSLVLIIGAAWYRVEAGRSPAAIVSVDSASSRDTLTQSNAQSADLATSTASLGAEKLTTTDLISRQLILDYVNLAASGQTTDENLAALASQYVERMPTLSRVDKKSSSDIQMVPDSESAFHKYADSLVSIKKETEKLAIELNPDGGLSSSAKIIGKIYSDSAGKLAAIAVPQSLVSSHLDLINNYLSSAAAMKDILSEDPAVAFAGLAAMNQNLNGGMSALTEIAKILNAHGI